MHPENIRKIFGNDREKAKRDYMSRRLCDEHTVDHLFSAWATILAAYDDGLLDAWFFLPREEEEIHRFMTSSDPMKREREIRLEAQRRHLERVRHANHCCGNVGTHGESGREYCSTCGQEQP